MKIDISQEDFGTLCICAIRYCQGRQTYMPSLVQGIVKEHIRELDDKDITIMLKDCKDQEDTPFLYGSETIDKPGWLAWKQALEDEKERRAHEGD